MNNAFEKTKDVFSKTKEKAEKMNPVVFIVLQVIVGLIISWIIYFIALMVLRADKLVIDNKFDANRKRKTEIMSGYADCSAIANNWHNASIETLDTYLPIRPSTNLKGGAQFTYQLWMYIGSPELCNNQVIFLRGDHRKYGYRVIDNTLNLQKVVYDRIAFCPMLSFASNPMEFKLQFNTLHNLNETLEITRLKSDNDAIRHNFASIFSQKWFLMTIVFEDNMPISDFENGLIVKVYINDVLYQVGKYATALRQNSGNLYVFPDNNPIPNMRMADFCYYNYAVNDDLIRDVSRKGPSTNATSSIRASFLNPSMISDLNRLEYANT